ncbi:hypothetical protein BROUX41_005936 [Berkeleyomyces rouxiae]|uniref:uncharacterized protein n=1 Tax=Berkeleyomyces rouxiae TaxID=2035830 RepID=UPI003B7EE2F9
MASKRKSQDLPDAAPSAPDGSAQPTGALTGAPVKRQRVSRACDQCRSAREKCDGVQPKCFSCVFLNRQCTYNVAPKKRGVQTGLIRTLESALVWVFDQFPGSETALNDLLAQDAGRQILLAQGRGNEAGNKLHRKWRKSRTHHEIDRLLSGKEGSIAPRPDAEEESESGTEHDSTSAAAAATAAATAAASSAKARAACSQRYHVPADAPRLLHIFFSYTHCWLPIVDRPRMQALAAAHAGQPTDVRDLELWCALAVAYLQDPAHHDAAKAAQVYATARSLLPVLGETDGRTPSKMKPDPDSDSDLDTPTRDSGNACDEEEQCVRNANGLLLLALVSLGRDNATTASALVGLAVRIVLRLHSIDRPLPQPSSLSTSSCILRKAKTTIACFILDTLISLRLGQPPHMTPDCLETVYPLPEDGAEEWDVWEAVPGFSTSDDASSGPTASVNSSPAMSIQSLSSLNQLCRFFQILSQSQAHFRQSSNATASGATAHGSASLGIIPPSAPPGQTAGLAGALDPRFSFCNSILGGTTPFLPTAFLLQTSFLSITLALMPDARLSLLWTLMESVEHAWLHLGPGSAPILVTYMSMAGRRARGLTGEDKAHWEALIAKLKRPWQPEPAEAQARLHPQAQEPDAVIDATPVLAKTPMNLSLDAGAVVFTHQQQQQQQYQNLMTPPDLFQQQHSSSAPAFISAHMHSSNALRTRTASFTPGTLNPAAVASTGVATNSAGSNAGRTSLGLNITGGQNTNSSGPGPNSNSSNSATTRTTSRRTGSTSSNGFPGNLMSPMAPHVPPYLMFQGQAQAQARGLADAMIDHDAILNELASIDCTDGMDSDAQFMANLGFAPGSDFTDMRGEFGSL